MQKFFNRYKIVLLIIIIVIGIGIIVFNTRADLLKGLFIPPYSKFRNVKAIQYNKIKNIPFCGNKIIDSGEECDGEQFCKSDCKIDAKPIPQNYFNNKPYIKYFAKGLKSIKASSQFVFLDDASIDFEFELQPQFLDKTQKITYGYDTVDGLILHKVVKKDGKFKYTETIKKEQSSLGPSHITLWFNDGSYMDLGNPYYYVLSVLKIPFNRVDGVMYETENNVTFAPKELAMLVKQYSMNVEQCYPKVKKYFVNNLTNKKRVYYIYINEQSVITAYYEGGPKNWLIPSPSYINDNFYNYCQLTIAHELVHVFIDDFPIDGTIINEAFAEYISYKEAKDPPYLKCTEDGYYYSNINEKQPYVALEAPNTGDVPSNTYYYTGNCMLRYIVETYGENKIYKLTEKMNELKNQGINGPYCNEYYKSFSQNIIQPVLGKSAASILKKTFGLTDGTC